MGKLIQTIAIRDRDGSTAYFNLAHKENWIRLKTELLGKPPTKPTNPTETSDDKDRA